MQSPVQMLLNGDEGVETLYSGSSWIDVAIVLLVEMLVFVNLALAETKSSPP